MSTEHPIPDKRTAVRPPALLLGLDADGRHHVLMCAPDPSDDEIHVVDGELVGTEPVNGRDPNGWIAYVDERVGWERIDYGPRAHEVV